MWHRLGRDHPVALHRAARLPDHSAGTRLPCPDLESLAQLVERAVSAGVDGVTVLASSGAGTSFSPEERATVVDAAVRAARSAGTGSSGRQVPVHVAVAAQSTAEVVRNAVAAQGGGADGLVLTPFSYVPSSTTRSWRCSRPWLPRRTCLCASTTGLPRTATT
ncbi:dihydrodipicolinate synthase family protein [Oerskovia sp. M15]